MVITQTPFRISFFGGGTDYPTWFRKHGGVVLSTTIDKYCFISCRHLPPFFEHKHRIVYSKIENVNSIEQINHPSVRAVFNHLEVQKGLEIHHDGDLPARSGIGSSSSFTVGLLHGLRALQGEFCSKTELASQAIYLEQSVMQENVGSQDQIAVAFGGLNRIDLRCDGSFDVTPLILQRERLEEFQSSLMLFYTRKSRFSSDVAKSQLDNMDATQTAHHSVQQIAEESVRLLQSQNRPLSEIGHLLHEAWLIKRQLSLQISSPEFDELYQVGRNAGALGGKLLGAGGGGFMLFFVPHEKQKAVREALSNLLEVPFRFEYAGSKIVYCNR